MGIFAQNGYLPQVAIQPVAMNALCVGVDNPLVIAFTEVPAEKISTRPDSIVLMKSSVIVIDANGFGRRARNTILNRLESELRKLGFTNVYRKADGNEASANFVLIVHPNDPINWAFRVRDMMLDEEVFVDRLAHSLTVNHTIGKFINKFSPCIYSDDALVLQR